MIILASGILRALLDTSMEVKVVSRAANGQEAVQLVADCQPDVVLMDAQIAIMDGLEAARHVKNCRPQGADVDDAQYRSGYRPGRRRRWTAG